MSVDVRIRQKGLLKKALPLSVILGEELNYGEFDGLRTDFGKLGESEFMAYHPKHMGRGFSVIWKEGEKNGVDLRLLNPTSREEIKDFFECVERISNYWNCDLEVDGEPVKAKELFTRLDDMTDFNQRVLHDMCKKIIDEGSQLTLHSVAFPIILGREEAETFLKYESTDAFRDYMHQKQSIDAYYPKPNFYRTDEGILGMYCLSEDVRSIFPKKPFVPLGICDPQTGKPLEVDIWKVFLYSGSLDSQIGELSYDELIARLPESKVSSFDAEDILIENLNLDEIKGLLR